MFEQLWRCRYLRVRFLGTNDTTGSAISKQEKKHHFVNLMMVPLGSRATYAPTTSIILWRVLLRGGHIRRAAVDDYAAAEPAAASAAANVAACPATSATSSSLVGSSSSV